MTNAVHPQVVSRLLRSAGVVLEVRNQQNFWDQTKSCVVCRSMILAGSVMDQRIAQQLAKARAVLSAHGYQLRNYGTRSLAVVGRS